MESTSCDYVDHREVPGFSCWVIEARVRASASFKQCVALAFCPTMEPPQQIESHPPFCHLHLSYSMDSRGLSNLQQKVWFHLLNVAMVPEASTTHHSAIWDFLAYTLPGSSRKSGIPCSPYTPYHLTIPVTFPGSSHDSIH